MYQVQSSYPISGNYEANSSIDVTAEPQPILSSALERVEMAIKAAEHARATVREIADSVFGPVPQTTGPGEKGSPPSVGRGRDLIARLAALDGAQNALHGEIERLRAL